MREQQLFVRIGKSLFEDNLLFSEMKSLHSRGDDIVCLGFFISVLLLHVTNPLAFGNRTLVH